MLKRLRRAWNNWRRDRKSGTPYEWRNELAAKAQAVAVAHDPARIRKELYP